jgi:hypothetical protein
MDTQKRYSDQELIKSLRILASDYNMKPTQRDILSDDRLPTHHTFNKRFGSVAGALEVAGLSTLDDSGLHNMVESIFGYYKVAIVDIKVHAGPLLIDFIVTDRDGIMHHIDVVELKGVELELENEIANMRRTLALPYVEHYHQIRDVGDAIGLVDILSGGAISADISVEDNKH